MTREKRESYSKQVVLITPQVAREWIDELNKNNYRPPSWVKVQQLADMMSAGKFFPQHPDGIQFDWFGRIGNGQHRLLAVIQSGVSVEFYVERGLDPEAFNYTDKNRPRSGADDLAAAGFRRDVPAQKAFAIASRMLMGFGTVRPIGDGSKQFALKYENLIGTVALELKSAKPYRSEVVAAFCKATFEFGDGRVLESAARFASKRFTGERGDPLAKLLDKVVAMRLKGGKQHELYAFAVGAIRADLEGRLVHNLYAASEDFLGPWESGYISLEKREQGRKGHRTLMENADKDRMGNARRVLDQARNAGTKFSLVHGSASYTFPKAMSGTVAKLVKELAPEIAILIQQENGVVAQAQPETKSDPEPAGPPHRPYPSKPRFGNGDPDWRV